MLYTSPFPHILTLVCATNNIVIVIDILYLFNFKTRVVSELCTTITILQNLTWAVYLSLLVTFMLPCVFMIISNLLFLPRELPLAYPVRLV